MRWRRKLRVWNLLKGTEKMLSQEEIDSCRDAFLAFDKDRSGTIDVWELRAVLEGARCARGKWFCPQRP